MLALIFALGGAVGAAALYVLRPATVVEIPAPAPVAPAPEEGAPPVLQFVPADYASLPGWPEADPRAALDAFKRSCPGILARPADSPFHLGRTLGEGDAARPAAPDFGPTRDWQAVCSALPEGGFGSAAAARAWLEARFSPAQARAVTGRGTSAAGLFTGYFEASLDAALAPDARHRYPVFGRPDDLVLVDLGRFRPDLRGLSIAGKVAEGRLQPYDTRAEIGTDGLEGRAPVLAWAADPVDLFFLHIQGSGQIRLPDGSALRVGYAAHNGHAYRSVGAELRDRGVNGLTSDKIARWLKSHPEEAAALMALNARYIFFRPIDGAGPIGAAGVALTPGHSLAVDPGFWAYGVPVWVDTRRPDLDTPGADGGALRRLMISQDTGAAITGPIRGDIFWGAGEQAWHEAGAMHAEGGIFALLPRRMDSR